MGEGSHIYSTATRATERGYTQKMARNITATESSIRHYADEELHVFNANGDHVKRIGGKGASVDLRGHAIPKDSIITHNHPRALGKSGIKAIGNSFSVNDIAVAVKNNVKEVRAVTPTYTFSLKRPKGGWSVSVDDLVTQYKAVKSERGRSLIPTIWISANTRRPH